MSTGWHVTAEHIVKWAETNPRRAQETLPLLIKRLIFESVSPSLIRFPSGDSVLEKGWDGILKTSGGSAYVPLGESAWELSTQKSVAKKANEDYSKRTKNPEGIDKKASTFVFVTTRKWRYRNWLSMKKTQGQWLDIKVLTPIELVDWLEKCPSVHRWFARLIGNRPEGAWDLEQAWDAWSLATKPPCNTDLVIAGRKDKSMQLSQLLSSKADIISISAETKEEAYAYVIASIKMHEWLIPRLLVVRDPKEWDLLVEAPNPLILVPWFENLPTLGVATQHDHWVVLPFTSSQSDKNITIVLEKANREQQIKALVEMGLSDSEAQEIVHKSQGKLKIIRRHSKLVQSGQPKPDWAAPEDGELLAATSLAGSWMSDNENDCGKIAYLVGKSYDEIEQHLNRWLRTGDYPIEHLGNKWQVVSYADAWQFLSPYISESILKRFGVTAVEVLKELDPRFDLPPEERWLASVHKKVTRFSVPLRHGLANALAILGSYGDRDCNVGYDSIQNQVSFWLRQILIDDMSELRWGSISPELDLLAEASPEMFLQAVEAGLQGKQPPILSLFVEEGPMRGGLFFSLLRGLECISWNLNYAGRVVLILATLASIDPGGVWSNRPYNTLKEIFLGWMPQTKAPLAERLTVLDALIRYNPEIGWKLLIDLLPRGGSISTPICTPAFRDWMNGWTKGVTIKEYHQHIIAISERILQHISKEPKTRWMDLLKCMSDLPRQFVGRAIEQLNQDLNSLPIESKIKIHSELREIVSRHRQYASAKWALPPSFVDQLDDICKKSAPADLVIRNAFLFDTAFPAIQNPTLYTDHKENSIRIEHERINALEQIWTSEQIAGIERLAKNVQFPSILGTLLSSTTFSDKVETELLSWLNEENTSLIQTARGYVWAMFSKKGKQWLDNVYSQHAMSWTERTWVSFCLGLPFNRYLFEFLQKFEDAIKKGFWENVNRYFLQEEDKECANWVVKQLLTYKRPIAAIDAAANFLYTIAKESKIDSSILAEALEQAANAPRIDSEMLPMDHRFYSLQKVLTEIEEQNNIEPIRLARIEWMYMPVFQDSEIKPKTLLNEILVNPLYFVHLICLMFKSNPPIENEFPNLPADRVKEQAINAWHLLKLVDRIPGQMSSSEIDLSQLRDWVSQARQAFEQKNRKKIGDEQIGEVLSHSPIGQDNIWPHEAVRNIIEQSGSIDLERGIEIGKFNQRGVITRTLSEGGEQERKIAEEYERQAEKIKFEFPRTAGMLLRFADNYKHQAMREDRDTLD